MDKGEEECSGPTRGLLVRNSARQMRSTDEQLDKKRRRLDEIFTNLLRAICSQPQQLVVHLKIRQKQTDKVKEKVNVDLYSASS